MNNENWQLFQNKIKQANNGRLSPEEINILLEDLQDFMFENSGKNETVVRQKSVLSDTIHHNLLHDYKHDLLGWQSELTQAIESGSNNRRLSIIKKVTFELSERIKKLTEEIDELVSNEESVDINRTILEIVRYYNLQLKGEHPEIIIRNELSEEIPLLWVKRNDIWEVISNILSNSITAVVAANRTEGLIAVRAEIVEKEIPYVMITVEDNGTGIRQEGFSHIFEKGFTTHENGTGLGLFIVSSIIESSYGGRIVVESKVGKGSTFRVLIPKARYQA